ncbi:MAG: UDP-N-acetylglucosamine pyrophosphorylase [Lachnospiraceae bacterium]|jgi:NDP-sugar pyrophosphorylase family protein|nr:UDP-N-acetylglucosamine pyrophosphorylase [Lachnospiraceae bacterium]
MNQNDLLINELFDLSHTIATELFVSKQYPWEVLSDIHSFIITVGNQLSPEEYELHGTDIWIAKDAVVAESASLTGPLIIDHEATIRHCAFIRGDVIVGKKCVVGNSTELKNCILFDRVQVPHYNYVGDSVLGYRSHMGAGSIASNLKTDQQPVIIRGDDQGIPFTIPTNRKKVGAILGDSVEVGCGCVLNPGTVIGKGSHIYPLSSIRGAVPAASIYKAPDTIIPIHS